MNEKHIHLYIHVYNVHCVQLKYQPTNQPNEQQLQQVLTGWLLQFITKTIINQNPHQLTTIITETKANKSPTLMLSLSLSQIHLERE